MKYNKIKYALTLFAAIAAMSCQEDYENFENKIYINATQFTETILVMGDEDSITREINVSIAEPIANDVTAQFEVNEDLLSYYQEFYYDSEAIMLPEECYAFDESSVEIQAGSVDSTPVSLTFTNVDLLDRSYSYILPVEMTNLNGIAALESATRFFYIFKGAALINVVPETTGNYLTPTWNTPSVVNNLSSWTMEALIYPYELDKLISTVMGIEGTLLIRIGDSGVDPNQIQLATSSGNVTSTALTLDLYKWQHVAVTYDGTTVTFYIDGEALYSQAFSISTANFGSSSSFYIGKSYDDARDFIGRMSEVRIWNRALSTLEIRESNHYYSVDTDADGLVSYWKMDEGEGSYVKDHTGNLNDMNFDSMPTWVSVSLPEI